MKYPKEGDLEEELCLVRLQGYSMKELDDAVIGEILVATETCQQLDVVPQYIRMSEPQTKMVK